MKLKHVNVRSLRHLRLCVTEVGREGVPRRSHVREDLRHEALGPKEVAKRLKHEGADGQDNPLAHV